MGTSWDGPKWRQQGRTGPGPVAPRYASARDRGTVRRGGTPGGPPKKGCAVAALLLISLPLAGIASAGYMIWTVFA